MTIHINPETGEHGKCSATIKDCPYQKKGDELHVVTHFKTVGEAKTAGEHLKEKLYGSFSTVDKTSNSTEQKSSAKTKVAKPKIIEVKDFETAKNLLESKDTLSSEQLKKIALFIDRNTTPDKLNEGYRDVNELCELLLHRKDLDEYGTKKLIKIMGLNNIIKDPNLSEEAYKTIAGTKMDRGDISYKFLQNKSIPRSALKILFQKNCNYTASDIIEHPNCDVELTDEIIFDRYGQGKQTGGGEWHIQNSAKNSNKLSEKSIDFLLRSPKNKHFYIDVKSLTKHPLCPKNLVEEYNKLDHYLQITESNTADTDTVDYILSEKFDKDFSTATNSGWQVIRDVKTNALCNSSMSDDTLIRILKDKDNDPDGDVGNVLAEYQQFKSKKVLDEVFKEGTTAPETNSLRDLERRAVVYSVILRSNGVTSDQINTIANLCADYQTHYAYERVLQNVAETPKTSPNLLKKLASHRLLRIKTAVAKNPSTPVETLEKLSNAKRGDVVECLLYNPKLSLQAQLNLINNPVFDSKYKKLIFLKECVNIDPAAIDALAEKSKKDPNVIAAIREHPKTSMKTLLKLGGAPQSKGDE